MRMSCSKRPHPDVITLMTKAEAALRPSQDRSLKMSRNDAHDDTLILPLEAVLKNGSKLWFCDAVAAANDKLLVEHGSHQLEICCTK